MHFAGNDKHRGEVYAINVAAKRAWSPRLTTTGGVAFSINDEHDTDRSFTLSANYRMSPTILLGVGGKTTRAKSKTSTAQNRGKQLELRGGFLLPRGYTINALIGEQRLRYESNFLVLSGDNRTRTIHTLQLGLLNRRLTWFGFSPRLSVIKQTSNTNYQLANYQSTAYQLNLEKLF